MNKYILIICCLSLFFIGCKTAYNSQWPDYRKMHCPVTNSTDECKCKCWEKWHIECKENWNCKCDELDYKEWLKDCEEIEAAEKDNQ